MDEWYDELLEHADDCGLSRDVVDSMKEYYDRNLDPLPALIAVMHEIGMCSENGDFSANWQEADQCGADGGDCLDEDEDEEDF
jgi:hypothetical protein